MPDYLSLNGVYLWDGLCVGGLEAVGGLPEGGLPVGGLPVGGPPMGGLPVGRYRRCLIIYSVDLFRPSHS